MKLLLALPLMLTTGCSLLFDSSANEDDAGTSQSPADAGISIDATIDAACPEAQPIETSTRCVECLSDTDCLGACNVRLGECIAPEKIVYVKAGANGTLCTPEDPCKLEVGVAIIESADSGKQVLSMSGNFHQNFTLDVPNLPMLVLGYGAEIEPY